MGQMVSDFLPERNGNFFKPSKSVPAAVVIVLVEAPNLDSYMSISKKVRWNVAIGFIVDIDESKALEVGLNKFLCLIHLNVPSAVAKRFTGMKNVNAVDLRRPRIRVEVIDSKWRVDD